MIGDAKTLDHLLDLALDLDEQARAQFLASTTVPTHLRDELSALLHAAITTGALDRLPAAVTALQAKQGSLSDNVKAGQPFGHYRLVRLLGEGGMASVWLAERDDLGHQVAVKCLKTGLATEEGKARFLREQQFLAQLQHPHIARLYDVGISSEGVPFILMEWVDGLSVTRYCDEHKLGITQRLRLFQKICAAVAYAHQNLVVHRDLKPANILVGADGEPKLLDFGIAKLLDESTEPVTRTGTYLLTPEYAAPEQFTNAAITTATDTYALGAILYELLSGLRPKSKQNLYAKENSVAITAPSEALRRLSKKSKDNPFSLREKVPEGRMRVRGEGTALSQSPHKPAPSSGPSGHLLPQGEGTTQLADQRATTPDRLCRALQGDLDTIVLKALQEESDRRYPTAQAFSEDIERYLQQQPIQARKDTWTYRTSKYLARHAAGVTLCIIVATALLVATTISINQAHRAQIQTQRAEAEAKRAELETQRAQTEAKRATAVKDFLTNLFEVSDSGMPRDQLPTTETLLQDGAKRIHNEFNEVPEVKFDLTLLLGRIQYHLLRFDQAEVLLKEAKIIADANFSPANDQWLQAHTAWNKLLIDKSEYATVAKQMAIAINKYKRAAGEKKTTALADAFRILGNAYSRLSRFDEAILMLRESVAMQKSIMGEHDASLIPLLQSLGITLVKAAHFNEAEKVLSENLALRREVYGEHNTRYARGLEELAKLYLEQNKFIDAERLARESIAIYEQSSSSNALIVPLTILGNALTSQNKLDEAEAAYKRVFPLLSTEVGSEAKYIALFSLANLAYARGHYHEAEQRTRPVLAFFQKELGSNNRLTLQVSEFLARVLHAKKQYVAAIHLQREALEIERTIYGANSKPLASSLYNLSLFEIAGDQPQQALMHIEEALHIFSTILTVNDPAQIDARLIKARVLNQLIRHQEAKNLLVSLIEQVRKTKFEGIEHGLADGLTELGRAQFGVGETINALASWNEALTLQRAKQPVDKEEMVDLEKLIAQARKNAP